MAKAKGHSTATATDRSRLLGPAVALLILGFTFAVYFPALDGPFVFDDQINITHNPYIRIESLAPNQLKRAMVQDRFQLRPLSNLSFALDYYFHGLEPWSLRIENVILHAANVFLLFLILAELIGRMRPTSVGTRWIASLLPALIWGAHPANCQAVTYLVQRQTELAVAGTLAAFLTFLKARQSTGGARAGWWVACLAALVLAAGSKEIGWTAPVILVLAELLILRPLESRPLSGRGLAAMGAGLFGLAAAGAVVLYLSGILGAYLGSYRDLGYGPALRLLTESRVLVDYVVTMFFPDLSRLALDQQVEVSRSLLYPITTLPALLVVLTALAGSIALIRRRPLLTFLGLGFFVALAPESTIIPVELKYDHRLYFASLFVVPPLLAGAALAAGPRRAAALLIPALLLLGVLTYERNRDWTSIERIWRDSAEKSPGLVRPWSNLCASQAMTEPRRALTSCGRAIALDPDQSPPYLNQGVALMALGWRGEAGASFAEGAKRDPKNPEAHYNLGAFYEQAGEKDRAATEYGRALELDQFHRRARLRRARLWLLAGKSKEARSELELLTRLYPDDQAAWTWLGLAALDRGDRPLANSAMVRARALGPPTAELEQLDQSLRNSSGAP